MLHDVPAARAAPAVNTMVAAACPPLLNAEVHVVVPQAATVGAATPVKRGITTDKVSPVARSAVQANSNVTPDAVFMVAGDPTVKTLAVRTGAANAGAEVGMDATGMFGEAAMVTAAVRVAKFAACAVAGVVRPAAIVRAHEIPAARAPPAAKVSVAVVVPEPVSAAVQVPQPPVTVGALAPEKPGNTRVILSAAAMGVFEVKVYVSDAAVAVIGLPMVRVHAVSPGVVVAVDDVMAAATISGDAAIVAAAVRVAKLAAWISGALVSPDAMITVHAVPMISTWPCRTEVRVRVAVAVPEPVHAPVHDVLPHVPVSCCMVVSAPFVPLKFGSTTVTLSLSAS
jgi:hypothetical protein